MQVLPVHALVTRVNRMVPPPTNVQQAPVPPLFTLPPELYPMIVEQLGFEDWLALKLSCKAFATLLRKTFYRKIRDHIVSTGRLSGKNIADFLSENLPAEKKGPSQRGSHHQWMGHQGDMAKCIIGTSDVSWITQLLKNQFIFSYEAARTQDPGLKALTCSQCFNRRSKSSYIDDQLKPKIRRWTFWPKDEPIALYTRICIPCNVGIWSMRPRLLVGGTFCWICLSCCGTFPLPVRGQDQNRYHHPTNDSASCDDIARLFATSSSKLCTTCNESWKAHPQRFACRIMGRYDAASDDQAKQYVAKELERRRIGISWTSWT